MKKTTILAIVLVIVSVSCTEQQKPVTKDFVVSVKKDTTYTDHSAITAPRFSCNLNQLLQPKFIGLVEKQKQMSVEIDTAISAKQMQDSGWYFLPNGCPVNFWKTYFPWILGAAFLAWFIWFLSSKKRGQSSDQAVSEKENSRSENYFSEKESTTQVKNVTGQNKETESGISSIDYNGISALVETAQKKDGVLKVTLNEHGLHVTYSNGVPGIIIDASNNGTIGDVSISDTNINNTESGRHFHGVPKDRKDQPAQ